MKKILILFFIFSLFVLTSFSYAIYETLPKDIGSNAELLEILNPEDYETINYSETYLISCMAEPDTEITLYEKYDDTLYVPVLIDNEAVTAKVGSSGLFLADITFKPNSTNELMIFAQKGNKYQGVLKTIIVKEKSTRRIIEHTILNIQNFVSNIFE